MDKEQFTLYNNNKHSTINTWGCLVSNNNIVLALSNDSNGSIFNCLSYSDEYRYNTYTNTYINNWNALKYDPINNIFIAVGNVNQNCIMTTSNGTSWDNFLALTGLWNDIICNSYNKTYYVVGNNSSNGYSGMMTGTSDLITWTAVTIPPGGWTSIASTGTAIPVNPNIVNTFTLVVVSNIGPNYLIYSLDSGVTWILSNTQIVGSWVKVIYANNLFVAISNVGPNYVIYSVDGKTWTKSTSQPSGNWNDIAYGNGMFLIVDKTETNKTYYSFDANSWSASFIPATNHIVFNTSSNCFISFGSENTLTPTVNTVNTINTFFYNPSNTSTPPPYNNNNNYIKTLKIVIASKTYTFFSHIIEAYFTSWCVYGNKQFFTSLTSSQNNISVINKLNQNNTTNTAVNVFKHSIVGGVYGNGIYLFISKNGYIIRSTTNGATFTTTIIPEVSGGSDWLKIVYGKGIFIILTPVAILYSTDTNTWGRYNLPMDSTNSSNKNVWSQICYGNKCFTILPVNLTNGILYSTDGQIWTKGTLNFQITSVSTTLWNAIVYGDKFVAINSSTNVNNIMYSDDGITWNLSKAPTDEWSSVAYGQVYTPFMENKYYYMACTAKDLRFMYSSNGTTWYAFLPNFNIPYNKFYEYRNASNIIVYGNYSFVICSPNYNVTINGTTINALSYIQKSLDYYNEIVSTYSSSQAETSDCKYNINKQILKDIVELVEKPFSINYNVTNNNGDLDNTTSKLPQALYLPGFKYDTKYGLLITTCSGNNRGTVCDGYWTKVRKRIKIKEKIGKLKINIKTKYFNVDVYRETRWLQTKERSYEFDIGKLKVLTLPAFALGIICTYSNTHGNISGSMFYDPRVNTLSTITSTSPIKTALEASLGINLASLDATKFDSILLSLSKYITTRSPEIFNKVPAFSEKSYTKYQSTIDNNVSEWYNQLTVDTIAITNLTIACKQIISIHVNHPLFSFKIPNLVIDIPEINLLKNLPEFGKEYPILIRPFSYVERFGILLYSKIIVGIPGLINYLADTAKVLSYPSLLIPKGTDVPDILFANVSRQITLDGLRETILILSKLGALPEAKKILDKVSLFIRYSCSLRYCFVNKSTPLYLQFRFLIFFKPFTFIQDLFDIANIAIGESFDLYKSYSKWIDQVFNTNEISKTNKVAAAIIDDIIRKTADQNVKWNKNCMQNILNKLSVLKDATVKKIFKYNVPLPTGDGNFNLTSFSDSVVSLFEEVDLYGDDEKNDGEETANDNDDEDDSASLYPTPTQPSSMSTTINTSTNTTAKNVFNYTAPTTSDKTDNFQAYNLDEYGSYPNNTLYTYPSKHFDIGDEAEAEADDDTETLTTPTQAEYSTDVKKNHRDSTFKTTFASIIDKSE